MQQIIGSRCVRITELWHAVTGHRLPGFGDRSPRRLSEHVAAGILACRRGRHLAARKNRSNVETLSLYRGLPGDAAVPPGWKPRLYVSQDGRRHHLQTGSKHAFSLVEVLIAVTLMSVIVIGLMATFNQTQRAFRSGITQVDVMEAGRAALEMMAREIEQARPTGLPFSTNFHAGWNGSLFVQSLPGTTQQRSNIQQNLLFTIRENQTWTGIGYAVEPPGSVGTLYRYETSASQLDPNLVGGLAANAFKAVGSRARVVDGVVHLRLLAYDSLGQLLNPYVAAKAFDRVLVFPNATGNLSYDYYFVSNAVPAYVELELGLLEAKTAERAANLPAAAQPQFLRNQVGHVQVFRQRIPIRNVDPSVYQ